ncbi:hypothetical protein MRX96_056829 [Rhipicephalus microplus]
MKRAEPPKADTAPTSPDSVVDDADGNGSGPSTATSTNADSLEGYNMFDSIRHMIERYEIDLRLYMEWMEERRQATRASEAKAKEKQD